jgi:Tol biopolymer transport system component
MEEKKAGSNRYFKISRRNGFILLLGGMLWALLACSLSQPVTEANPKVEKSTKTLTPTLVWRDPYDFATETSQVLQQTRIAAATLGTYYPTEIKGKTYYPTSITTQQVTESGVPKTPTRTRTATYGIIKYPTRTSIYYRSRTPTKTYTQRVMTETVTLTKTITPTPSITKTPTVTPTPTVTHTATETQTSTVTHTPTVSSTPTPSPTPTVTPDWVIYSAPASSGEVRNIWLEGLYGTASSSRQLVYHHSDGDSIVSDISPDGNSLIFSGLCGEPEVTGLCWLDISSTPYPEPLLLNALPEGLNSSPSFSPNGNWIVFSNENAGDADLYMIDVKDPSAVPFQLTSGVEMDTQPDWSSMGIVFIRDGDPMKIVFEGKFPPAEPPVPQNIFTSVETEADVRVSPNGNTLAFSRLIEGDWEIYLFDFTSTTQTMLTNNRSDDRQPAWSPDGSEILFISDRDAIGVFQLYLMTNTGDDQLRVLNNLANEFYPLWLP